MLHCDLGVFLRGTLHIPMPMVVAKVAQTVAVEDPAISVFMDRVENDLQYYDL